MCDECETTECFLQVIISSNFASKPHRVNLFEGRGRILLIKPYTPDNTHWGKGSVPGSLDV